MSIENITPDNRPKENKYSTDTKENFSGDEQKLIDIYSKYILKKNIFQNEIIDSANMEAETKKVGGEAGRSDFFEKNYKTIFKNPDKYPTLSTLLQIRIQNNKIAVDKMFEENLKGMNKILTREESDFFTAILNSYEMQFWLQQNPEKNKRVVWDKYNNLLVAKILERIDHKERNKLIKLNNIVKRVVDELFYAADNDIQKNNITDKTQEGLTTVNAILTSLSKNNPDLYQQYSTIHQKTQEHISTIASIKGEEMLNQMNFDIFQYKENKKSLEDFLKITKNKDQDPNILKNAVIIIKPTFTSIYKDGLEKYNQAKEEQDPLQKIITYKEAQEQFKQINNTKEKSGIDFSLFDEELETFCSLSKEMENEIENIFKDNTMLPLLYEAGYKIYQEALTQQMKISKEKNMRQQKHISKLS